VQAKHLAPRGLRHLSIHYQGIAVVYELAALIALQCQVGLGCPAQQRVGIDGGSVCLVAVLDTSEITLRTLLIVLDTPKPSPWHDERGGG
jgi:hypothetical protein